MPQTLPFCLVSIICDKATYPNLEETYSFHSAQYLEVPLNTALLAAQRGLGKRRGRQGREVIGRRERACWRGAMRH